MNLGSCVSCSRRHDCSGCKLHRSIRYCPSCHPRLSVTQSAGSGMRLHAGSSSLRTVRCRAMSHHTCHLAAHPPRYVSTSYAALFISDASLAAADMPILHAHISSSHAAPVHMHLLIPPHAPQQLPWQTRCHSPPSRSLPELPLTSAVQNAANQLASGRHAVPATAAALPGLPA